MKTRLLAVATAAFVLTAMVLFGIIATAAEFSADVEQTANGRSMPGKLYVKDQRMRLETMGSVTIVDSAQGKSWVLMPGVNAYLEMNNVGSLGRGTMSEEQIAEFGKRKLLGKETVNGYECDKYLVEPKDGSQGTFTQWVSEKLQFPVKFTSEGGGNDVQFELTNIQEGPVEDSLFTIPSGYQKMEMPNMKNMQGMAPGMGQGQR